MQSMNTFTLEFNSPILERMYQNNREVYILKLFRVMSYYLFALAIIFMVTQFAYYGEYTYGFIIAGGFLLHVICYYYITKVRNDYAKYVVSLLSVMVSGFFFFDLFPDQADCYLFGLNCALLEVGLLSQNGTKNNILCFVAITCLDISSTFGNRVSLPLIYLPFCMLFAFSYFYIAELQTRQLFLQSLKEDSWLQILPKVCDKKLMIMSFDQEKLSFSFKFQNIVENIDIDKQQKEIKRIMRSLKTDLSQNLEQYLFKRYQDLKKGQDYMIENTIQIQQIGSTKSLFGNKAQILILNLKELNFIVIFQQNQDKWACMNNTVKKLQNYLVKITEQSSKNLKKVEGLFQCVTLMNIRSHPLMVTKAFQYRRDYIITLIQQLNLNFSIKMRDNKYKLSSNNSFELLSHINYLFFQSRLLDLKTTNERNPVQYTIITDSKKLQLLFLNIFRSLFLCKVKASPSITIQNENDDIALFIIKVQIDKNYQKIPKIIPQLISDLGPNNYIQIIQEIKFGIILTLDHQSLILVQALQRPYQDQKTYLS